MIIALTGDHSSKVRTLRFILAVKNRSQLRLGVLVGVLALILALAFTWHRTAEKLNSLKRHGENLNLTNQVKFKTSDRANPDPEPEHRRNISDAAQKWYEQLLEKYPILHPDFREVIDEQNGFLQFLLLAESIGKPRLPEDLRAMVDGKSPWESDIFEKWISENQSYFIHILHVAELPDQSIKGIDYLRFNSQNGQLASEFSAILRSSAKVAFDAGNRDQSLRYYKAAHGLARHLIDVEVPSMFSSVVSSVLRQSIEASFRRDILPTLAADQEALRTWREELFFEEGPVSEFSRVLEGEWNASVRNIILPAILRRSAPFDTQINKPDIEAFVDTYASMVDRASGAMMRSSWGRLILPVDEFILPDSGLSAESQDLLQSLVSGYQQFLRSAGQRATRHAMNDAIISILLDERPMEDPVSGKPFRWDPATRTISSPDGTDDPVSIKVP